MNYEQLRIAMNAYNKRMQLEEAHKKGHSDAVNEQGGRLGGFAAPFKTALSTLKGPNLKSVKALKKAVETNPAARKKLENYRKAIEHNLGRPLSNAEMDKVLLRAAQKGIINL